mmetsp:Transcript_13690/g.49796  ORF Transcript_13690/g.49796 Transcript_13690/m.49796 type:complete len:141 (-) Transcript_13690:92-514(-)
MGYLVTSKANCFLCSHVAKLAQDREISQHTSQVLLDLLNSMGGVIGGCERLLSTPMPLSYTRHTTRTMMVFLMTLPFALWPLMGWATVPCIFLITFILIGIEETGVEIEEPFCILPLHALCEAAERDVSTYVECQAAAEA